MARHLLAAAVLVAALALAVASPLDYEADSITVRMEHDLASVHHSAFSVQSAAAADAAGELGKPIGRHLRRVKLQAGAKLQQQLERLRAIKGVKYVVPDHRIYPHRVDTMDKQQQGEGDAAFPLAGLSSRESFKFQWGSARIGMPDAWAIPTGTASLDKAVTLCVVAMAMLFFAVSGSDGLASVQRRMLPVRGLAGAVVIAMVLIESAAATEITERCVAFEWNANVNGGMCFLKDSSGLVPRPLEGARSGVLVSEGAAISAATIKANNAGVMAGMPVVGGGSEPAACAPAKTDL